MLQTSIHMLKRTGLWLLLTTMPHFIFAQNVLKTYPLFCVEEKACPVLDGKLDDLVWDYAPIDSLKRGGEPADYLTEWILYSDFLVIWQAVWCEQTNLIYVGLQVFDDIRGVADNGVRDPYYYPSDDESIEFCTDGNFDGGNYWPLFGPAQYWRVTQKNERDLEHFPGPDIYPAPYEGNAFETATQLGDNGNWTCEAVFRIYNHFPSYVRTLAQGDQIGWDIWANDSDNDHHNGDYFYKDHQIGWHYSGPVWKDADHCGIFELFGCTLLPSIRVQWPNGNDQIQEGSEVSIAWESNGGIGDDVSIHLYHGSEFVLTIAAQTHNDGNYKWKVPYGLNASNAYRIRIRSFDEPSIEDYSDEPFEIFKADLLTILYPDEPDLYFYMDDIVEIQWIGLESPEDSVRIELIGQDHTIGISEGTLNDGYFIWQVNDDVLAETDYTLRITSLLDERIFRESVHPLYFYRTHSVKDGLNPESMALHLNYPNPFNPYTTIPYSVSHAGQVQLTIYNVLGKAVRHLVNAEQTAGAYEVQWDGKNDAGQQVSSGIFVVEMRAGAFVKRRKVMLLR